MLVDGSNDYFIRVPFEVNIRGNQINCEIERFLVQCFISSCISPLRFLCNCLTSFSLNSAKKEVSSRKKVLHSEN